MAALDRNRLASGSDDKSIIIWNLADGAQLAKLEGHTEPVWSLAALDGGRLAQPEPKKKPETSRVMLIFNPSTPRMHEKSMSNPAPPAGYKYTSVRRRNGSAR